MQWLDHLFAEQVFLLHGKIVFGSGPARFHRLARPDEHRGGHEVHAGARFDGLRCARDECLAQE